MEFLVPICIIASLHCLLYFFDQFFKSCAHYPYIEFLRGTGFKINFMQIKWSTKALNRTFLRWGCAYNRFYEKWFSMGSYISLVMVPISIYLLLYSIFQNHFPTYSSVNTTSSARDSIKIVPVLPGVNLPINELSYYVFTLIFCSIVHELGHAIAAVREDINVMSVGINLYFVLPIAYVNLPSDKLGALKPWRTLRILCAGIWHNIVLTAIAYVIYTSIPFIYSMVFNVNEGMYVKTIASNSPLIGDKGIQIGDIITSINYCETNSSNDYYHCLMRSQITTNLGYCLEKDIFNSIQKNVQDDPNFEENDCCKDTVVQGSLCFRSNEDREDCLPVRPVLMAAMSSCTQQANCSTSSNCLRPTSLTLPSRLLKITLANSTKPPIIYIGLPYDLYHTLTVSPYIPKYPLATLLVPDQVLRTLQYLAMFSFGLAIVNALPCLQMDGQHILCSVLKLLAGNKWKVDQIQKVTVTTCFIGTITLVWHCGWSLYKTIFSTI